MAYDYDQPGNAVTETEEDDLYKPTSTGDKEDEKGPKRLNLLELAEQGEEGKRKAAERMVAEWNESDRDMHNNFEQWRVNRAQREGVTGAYVIKKTDRHEAWVPPGTGVSFRGMNKAARLSRRLVAQIMSDPPAAEVEAEGGSDEERDRAEFTGRVLAIMGASDQLDVPGSASKALDLGSTYGSGFRHWSVDPKGNGHRATEVYVTAGLNPYTEQPYSAEYPGPNPVLHYVQEDGTFSMEKTGNEQRTWLPRVDVELLTGKNVRFIPHNCGGVQNARGLKIGAMLPWGVVKERLPELMDLSEERIEEIVKARPKNTQMLIPKGHRGDRAGENYDEHLVFVLTEYHKSGAEYPYGAYLIVLGDSYLAHSEEWYDEENDEPLDIPVDQFMQYEQEDNPYGGGCMQLLAAGNDIRSQMIGKMLEHLEHFTNRKVFVPLTSNLQAHQLQAPTKTVINIAPGGEPKYEDLPNFPTAVKEMLPFVSQDMDDEVGLQEPAQGKASPSVDSGVHARQLIEQTNIGLSPIYYNAQKGLIRGWKIILQLTRAFYTVRQRIEWVGEDGCYKEKMWRGVDLTSGSEIKIKRGTMTMMSPSMKTAAIAEWQQLGFLSQQDAIAAIGTHVSRLTGHQDSPHRQRVRQEISYWMQGPPEGWQPPQPQIDPQTGQPMPPPPSQVFPPLPVDLNPEVAALREYEFGRALATSKFASQPPPWQQELANAYTQARQAAGIQTVQEQAQAAQAQQEAAQAEMNNQKELEGMRLNASMQEAQLRSQTEVQKTAIAQQGRANSQNATP